MPDENEPADKGQELISWEFPEYVHPERGRAWYLTFAVIFLVVMVTSILSANYTFAFIILIAAFIYLVRMRRMPPMVRITLFEDGVEVGSRFYRWDVLKEFVILYHPPEIKKLYLEFKAAHRPSMDVSLENQNPLRLRGILSEYLPENIQREEEPLTDQWARFLKL